MSEDRRAVDDDADSVAAESDSAAPDADPASTDVTFADPESLTLSARLSAGIDHFRARMTPFSRALDRSVRNSRLADVGRRVRAGVSNSRLVRWLTREPDPAVVVIDLAETRTIGPVLRVLDRIAGVVGRTARATGVAGRATNAARLAERNAVPFASGALLGLVIGTLALTWEGANPLWLVALAIAGVAGMLGLTVDRSPSMLAESKIVQWLGTALAPPGDEDAAERTR